MARAEFLGGRSSHNLENENTQRPAHSAGEVRIFHSGNRPNLISGRTPAAKMTRADLPQSLGLASVSLPVVPLILLLRVRCGKNPFMPFQIIIRASTNQPSPLQADNTPDRCPICHFSITPIDWTIGALRNNGQKLERLLQCPNASCQRLFVAQYEVLNQVYMLKACVPAEIRTPAQSEVIKAISDDFCKIYDEAYKAEQANLKLVAGPGYRKALEFLIKDYIVSQYPEKDAEKIAAYKTDVERTQLAPCIARYIKNEQIREIAKRATWLGNDETHYVRKWEGKDLEDLKKLISLTLHWIEMEKLTADVIKDMPETKPKPA